MLFQKSLVGENNRNANAQWEEVLNQRALVNSQEQMHNVVARQAGVVLNEGLIPQDVYQEFDRNGVDRFRLDDGDNFLNDLMPLSKSVNIGRLVHKFRRTSDAGVTQTSMSGQLGIVLDQVAYNYDGTLVPIHDTGFKREWRSWNAMQVEGFDPLIDEQREHVAKLRKHIATAFLDGHYDKQGNLITMDGVSWQGMRNDTRVAQVDLGAGGLNFDFTDQAQTGEAIKNAFMQLRDILRIDNKCGMDATYYVSEEIASNFERRFSTQYDARLIEQELTALRGVAGIKVTNLLVGNELMAFPLNSDAVKPVVGMALNTVAVPRPVYNSDYIFLIWAAVGFEVRTDYSGNTCAMYATG